MNESMLNSLMRLFAIMVSINRGSMHLIARNSWKERQEEKILARSISRPSTSTF